MEPTTTERCFLLTHNSRDCSGHFEIDLFAVNSESAPLHITITNFRPLFFTLPSVPSEYTRAAAERKPLSLRTFNGISVDCCYFATHAALRECARRLHSASLPVFESDIHPVDRFLMERSVMGGFEATGSSLRSGKTLRMVNPRIRGADFVPKLTVLSLDIETDVNNGSLYSIACSGRRDAVFIVGKGNDHSSIYYCHDEKKVIERFLRHMRDEDPDVLIGWNVIGFDLKMIAERCRELGIPFIAGRDDDVASVVSSRTGGNRTAVRIDGRVIIDVPVLLRAYYRSFEEYSLNHVAATLLHTTKDITLSGAEKIAAIDRLYTTDKEAFAHYNLQDALLTREIFERTDMLPNAIERSRRSGHLLDRPGGSIAAFDYLYLPRLHRFGYVAPDAPRSPETDVILPGGYVIEPKPGIYENVLVLDFRSLYPSIIMSFAIDPLGCRLPSVERIQGPAGPSFARTPAILPSIISELLEARNEAKRNNNPHLSQAIKILMNSFYGVLGARNCRFFSAELASTITRTGQYILKKAIEFIVASTNYPVIYGDTDSLFVLLGPGHDHDADAIGRDIAHTVTEWFERHLAEKFNAASALLLQFETHYRYFLIPAVRGGEYGSKKHYCGGSWQGNDLKLHFKGMESARGDWTDLAKEFQQELIRRIFTGEPVDEYILQTVSDVTGGRVDGKLLYKKRMRKRIDDYTQSIPPHVQAAKLLDRPPHLVRYYVTIDGPQPVEKFFAPIDYRHYVDCQLQPVADSVLELTGKSFARIVSGQQDLFGGP
ncbi:MAG: DNA polymerase II [Chitinispirillaceae bacterium]|nr:DNA polymerase II [Chitinispirillaceae bacterium]